MHVSAQHAVSLFFIFFCLVFSVCFCVCLFIFAYLKKCLNDEIYENIFQH